MKWHRRILLLFLLFMITTPLLSFFSIPPAQAVFGSEDIFFEYGAESGELEPPWDWVEEADGSAIEVVSSPVRTGDYAVSFYQPNPPKSDVGRRARVWKYQNDFDTRYTEFYMSWWLYFPDEPAWTGTSDQWQNLGGWTLWFGDSGNTMRYYTGGGFRIPDGGDEIDFGYTWWKYPQCVYDLSNHYAHKAVSTGFDPSDHIGEWVHLQTYAKITTGGDSVIQGWLNGGGDLFSSQPWGVGDFAGIDCADPSAYDEWNNYNGEQMYWNSRSEDGYPCFEGCSYGETTGLEKTLYMDDFVWATEKVTESYGVGYVSAEFESWEDGFESGDFSAWNNTDYSGGGLAPSVTSTLPYFGSYSANFSCNGVVDAYSRSMYVIQPIQAVFQRSYVRLEDLPVNNSRIHILRTGMLNDTWITTVAVENINMQYYWHIDGRGAIGTNRTLSTINADQWYLLETYQNITVNGNFTLWVNNTITCEDAGNYSNEGTIQRVYPIINIKVNNQAGVTSVCHDNYRVDNTRISGNVPPNNPTTPKIFQASQYFSAEAGQSPLEYITINGTRATDLGGYYEWSNLTYGQQYVFVVGNATGYYPAWCLNVDGSYYWNGTDWIITHTLFENQSGYIQMSFYSTSQPYIHYTDAMLTSASMNTDGTSILYYTGDDSGAKTVEVYSPTQPTYIMGKSYNSSTDYVGTTFNMSYTFSGAKSFALSWQDFDGVVVNATTGELSTEATWERQMLTLYITDTGTSTTDVYASTLGEPHWVIGEQTWSYNETTSMVYVVVAHSSEEEVEISWATWLFTFRGLYDERSGLYLSTVDVTAYYINLTSTSFTVDETYYFSSDDEPLYFLFDLSPYDRQYWIHGAENDTTIYIQNASTTVYTVAFLDLAGALDDYPYVEVKHYLNGTLQTVEKRRVDEEKKIQASLMEGETYSVVIRDGTAYTYGDLLMTSTTTLQLTLKGIQFPKDTLLLYKNVRVYGDRAFDVPNGSIALTYADELNQTNTVDIYINYKNGTNAYNGTETTATFVHTWSSAMNDTDYRVVAIMNHSRYGVTTWNQYFPRGGYADAPWSLDFLGIRLPFDTSVILPSLLILMIAGAGVKVKPEVGAFLAVITAMAFTLLRWLPLGSGALITAFTLAILMAVIYKRWRVRM